MGAQQWRTAQESLLGLENNSVASVDSIFRYTFSISERGMCMKK